MQENHHSYTIQTLGAILYFYGDNIGYIMQNYSEELGCGDQCILNNQIAAIMSLGLALIILHFFPDVALSGTFIALCMVVGVAFIFVGLLLFLDKN